MCNRITEEADVVVRRDEYRQKEEYAGKEKTGFEEGRVLKEFYVDEKTEQRNSKERYPSDLIKQIERAVQVRRRYCRSEYFERAENPENSSEINRELLFFARSRSRFCNRSKCVDADVLTSVVKRLPCPVSQ